MTTFTVIMVVMIFVGAILALGKYRYNTEQEDLQILELIKKREAHQQATGAKMISEGGDGGVF